MIFSSLYGTRLSRELNTADSTVLFTDAARIAAILDAQREFADQTECWVRRVTLAGTTIVNGEIELSTVTNLAAVLVYGGDFVRLADEGPSFKYTDASSNVTILAGRDLPRRDIPWLDRSEPGWRISTVTSTAMQLPRAYYLRREDNQTYLGFWPVPSTGSSASMTVQVPYVALPTANLPAGAGGEPFSTVLVGAGRADLRPYHQGLVHYAASQLEKYRGDWAASDRQYGLFQGYVARWFRTQRRKGGQGIPVTSYFRPTERVTDPRT